MKSVNNELDLVITFDTTGSMSPAIAQVRRNTAALVRRMGEIAPGIRIAVCAHGDYCDGPRRTTWLDFTTNIEAIAGFIERVPNTYGGDAPECYELVLHEARDLSWNKLNQKALVMIGDSDPHSPAEALRQGGKRLDWREEMDGLGALGVNVYGVHCLSGYSGKQFFQEIAKATGGFYLHLDQFRNIEATLLAIVMKQARPEMLEAFEQELDKLGQMNRGLESTLYTLSGKVAPPRDGRVGVTTGRTERSRYERVEDMSLRPVESGRFQMLEVDHDTSIADFVRSQGMPFQVGRGFYEFTKRETIQGRKEVILMDRRSGDFFTGAAARKLLGLPDGVTSRIAVPEEVNRKYVIFVQSTSSNRKLLGGTKFLYEVHEPAYA